MTFTVECQGATGLPVVTTPLQDGCTAVGGTLVYVESQSLDPFDSASAEEVGGFISACILFLSVIWVLRKLQKAA